MAHFVGAGAHAQSDLTTRGNLNAPFEIVQFGETDTLRDFVGEYLGDPDLWPYVLQLNRISSPADVRPGISISLPVQQVRAADSALLESLQAIQSATAEGAQVFAPREIGDAIESRDNAIAQREVGEWRQVVDLSNISTLLAKEALDIAIAQRDRSAEAIVSDVQGRVEGRAPAEPSWSGRARDDILVEFERVRTLSDSTTQITFRDLSRLRLNANSNATIQRMRSDPLTGGEVTKVSLVNGDFYALLNQLSERTSFEIDVEGIETTTDSVDFWIKNDTDGARFVNYDTAALEISGNGAAVSLGRNEGAVLSGGTARRANVLTSPQLTAPVGDAIIYTARVGLSWDLFEGAEAYWVEVASDSGFNQMAVSEWGIRGSGFETPALPPSQYFWRVAALDALGLPGEWSRAERFVVRVDTTPPFLTLLSPGPDVISDMPEIEVFGASEPLATVLLNGAPVELGSDGSFLTPLRLQPGENRITLRATDPAGNQSETSQVVVYRPAFVVEIVFDAGLPRSGEALATRSAELAVSAQTNATTGAPVTVRDEAGGLVAQTVVGAGGALQFSVPVDATVQSYNIEILAPGGAVEGRASFAALRDEIPPEIAFDLPVEKATGEAELRLDGTVGDAVQLTLNGESVPVSEGRFTIARVLSPGANGFDLVAIDAVGNVAARRVQTLYDIDPPEILRADAFRPSGEGGPIQIEVEARDASGLRQAAEYLLSIGDSERSGFLRCDVTSGICRASLPPEAGEVRLIEVVIEDYAGNLAYR